MARPQLVLSPDHPLRFSVSFSTSSHRDLPSAQMIAGNQRRHGNTSSHPSDPLAEGWRRRWNIFTKRAKWWFFWIYDDHWVFVLWVSVVMLFLCIIGWIFHKNQQAERDWTSAQSSSATMTTSATTTSQVAPRPPIRR
ncbi:hypothetical protein Slin15195_G022910 [Septoria linicola]|uniref:Uncharacterized protein n=1 Tax=Septoria linicola TaxID=215465 RepID=A0A9Q9AMY5_9PEZI|nr:hypothetical protein Slin15195_G022910 [Septoria linicola]